MNIQQLRYFLVLADPLSLTKTAEKYYKKYTEKKTGIKAVCLPSTSPANAAWSIERLTETWSTAILKENEA